MNIRVIVGKKIVELSDSALLKYLQNYSQVVLDLGAGDGKNTLRLAEKSPTKFYIGVDAVKENLVKTSLKTALSSSKYKNLNLLFIWSAVEQLPILPLLAEEVIINMPWGSLQYGIMGHSNTIMQKIAATCTKQAVFTIRVNLHPWEKKVKEVAEIPYPTAEWVTNFLQPYYRKNNWQIIDFEFKELVKPELSLASSWSKRVSASKPVFKLLQLTGVINP